MMSTRVFTNENISITTYIDSKQTVYFKGKDVAKALGYCDTMDAVKKHVDPEDKVRLQDIRESAKRLHLYNEQPQTVLIKEPGIYSLIFSSKLPSAKVFKSWVFSEVLPAIRKNGYYSRFNSPNPLVFKVENEYDLHTKVVGYIRRFHPSAVIIAGLGELQDTKFKRIKSYCKGYKKGQPDMIISNYHKLYRGLCLEFKSPTGNGVVSNVQKDTLKTYEANGYKCLVSNDYDLIIREVNNYFQNVRIPCLLCRRGFKTSKTLYSHKRYFHRIHPKYLAALSNLS